MGPGFAFRTEPGRASTRTACGRGATSTAQGAGIPRTLLKRRMAALEPESRVISETLNLALVRRHLSIRACGQAELGGEPAWGISDREAALLVDAEGTLDRPADRIIPYAHASP